MLEGINIHAPKTEETIVLEGVFLYSDGKPVVNETVRFEPEKTKEGVEGEASVQTDSSGRFSIKILKGLKGELYGEMYTYIGEFEKCPKLESIIKKTKSDDPNVIVSSTEIKTPTLKLQAENDLYDVELRFPFPGCKKAKQE
jgi:hypothetical protein